MEYINFIAITKEDDKPQQISLPIDFAIELNKQFKNYPNGVPITTTNRVMTVKALIIATKSFMEEPFILIPINKPEEK